MKRKSNVLTIMKKELARFFGDRRMVLSIFLPGLLIYLIYSLMGDALMSGLGVEEDTKYTLQVKDVPTSIQEILQQSELPFETVEENDPMAAVEEQELDFT